MPLDFGTVAGLAAATVIIVQALLAAISPTPALRDRIGPATALIVAMALSFATAIATGTPLIVALATGITAAGGSTLLHDGADSAGLPV